MSSSQRHNSVDATERISATCSVCMSNLPAKGNFNSEESTWLGVGRCHSVVAVWPQCAALDKDIPISLPRFPHLLHSSSDASYLRGIVRGWVTLECSERQRGVVVITARRALLIPYFLIFPFFGGWHIQHPPPHTHTHHSLRTFRACSSCRGCAMWNPKICVAEKYAWKCTHC